MIDQVHKNTYRPMMGNGKFVGCLNDMLRKKNIGNDSKLLLYHKVYEPQKKNYMEQVWVPSLVLIGIGLFLIY